MSAVIADVIVIGGGHAGVEAAAASARLGVDTVLLTQRVETIGVMSCNPAIGGLGRGHLVREIDALDGIMGIAIDAAGIQFRLLNRRKGPAVQGPRAQADRRLYAAAVRRQLAQLEDLRIVEGEVVAIDIDRGAVRGLRDDRGRHWQCKAIVLTTATFLRGVIHLGPLRRPAGRQGDRASEHLARSLDQAGLRFGRLKTGTPPRLDGRTIAFEKLETQMGDPKPVPFSFATQQIDRPQVVCHIAYTNAMAHEFVRKNIDQAPSFSGQIEAGGVRYCPSIEDKVVRFPDRQRHHIFLEPEGLDDITIYPNGISTALPPDHQMALVRMIQGLESVILRQPGYAIEYDHVDPRCLTETLEVKATEGLFLAGQINGTTGYEEAAAQGVVAGTNAALRLHGGKSFTLHRSDAYIGVLIDDLTTRGVREPYRMFTSRAEYRLSLRAGNADLRLTPRGISVGLISPKRRLAFKKRVDAYDHARSVLAQHMTTSLGRHKRRNLDGRHRSLLEWLGHPDIDIEHCLQRVPELAETSVDVLDEVVTDAKYAPYLRQQADEINALKRDESLRLPSDLAWERIPGLSKEMQSLFGEMRPGSLAAASRLPGVTPAAIALLHPYVLRTH